MRAIPQAAIDLAKTYEGFKPTRYYDPTGKATIGYGHLLSDGDPLWDKTLSEPSAETLLVADMGRVAAIPLYAVLGDTVADSLTDGQYAALLDFVFNEGIGHFAASTMHLYIKSGTLALAGPEFSKWIYAANKVEPGLVARRAAEAALWNA